MKIELEEALTVSSKTFGHFYEGGRCNRGLTAVYEAKSNQNCHRDEEILEEHDSTEITTWQSTHTSRAERKRRRDGFHKEYPDLLGSDGHDATLSTSAIR